MATQYDPDASAFSNSTQMENYDYATACKPAEHMIHGVETKSRQRVTNMLYTRTGATSKDKILTDVGTFQVATEAVPLTLTANVVAGGTSPSVSIGELWVAYKVKLSRANINISQTLSNANFDFYVNTCSASQLYVTGSSGHLNADTLGTTLTAANATTMYVQFPQRIQAGAYYVVATAGFGSSTTSYFNGLANMLNCSTFQPTSFVATPTTTAAIVNSANTASGQFTVLQAWILVNAPGNSQAQFQITTSAAFGAGTWTLQIIQIPTALNAIA